MTANATFEKKLDVPVQPACARRFGFPRTKRRPAFSSVQMPGFVPSAGAAIAGSAFRMRRTKRPEAKEADRVDEDRVWGCEELDEATAHARAADLSRRAADLELRVALDDLVALDERRDVRHVRDVEEDGADPDEEPDDEELSQRQDVGDVRDRDRREQRSAPEVARDEDRSARQPVDPDTCRKREEDERQELDDAERRDLERGRVEHEQRGKRERELGHLRPELADRLGRPELQEVRVPPEAACRPEPHVRSRARGRADRRHRGAPRRAPRRPARPRSARASRADGVAARAGSRGTRARRRSHR